LYRYPLHGDSKKKIVEAMPLAVTRGVLRLSPKMKEPRMD